MGKFRGSFGRTVYRQHLLYKTRPYENPTLYYWARDVKNSKAEVDYVIESNGMIIPVEVKMGSSKKLKSLQVFLSEKKLKLV